MQDLNQFLFQFIAFVFFGLSMEVIFSVTGIELALGKRLTKNTPHKYLEGFVSLYMIPIHGLGMTFGFIPFYSLIHDANILVRYICWSVAFTLCEILGGIIYQKVLGFYPWDYYKESRFKIFSNGYSLWTLIPLWGVAGLILEKYTDLILKLSKYI